MYYTKLYFESNGVSTYDLYMRLISTDAQIILKYLDAFLLLHSNINVTIKCQMTGYASSGFVNTELIYLIGQKYSNTDLMKISSLIILRRFDTCIKA